jgi:hypothetical protein
METDVKTFRGRLSPSRPTAAFSSVHLSSLYAQSTLCADDGLGRWTLLTGSLLALRRLVRWLSCSFLSCFVQNFLQP